MRNKPTPRIRNLKLEPTLYCLETATPIRPATIEEYNRSVTVHKRGDVFTVKDQGDRPCTVL